MPVRMALFTRPLINHCLSIGGSMKVMIDFFRTILRMPKHWVVWVGLLMIANMVVPLFFIETLAAQVTLAAMMAGAAIQMVIFKMKGFVRLLGIGHILWVPMVIWLALGFESEHLTTPFGVWVAAVILLDSISLVIDGMDVVRYIKGERTPTLSNL